MKCVYESFSAKVWSSPQHVQNKMPEYAGIHHDEDLQDVFACQQHLHAPESFVRACRCAKGQDKLSKHVMRHRVDIPSWIYANTHTHTSGFSLASEVPFASKLDAELPLRFLSLQTEGCFMDTFDGKDGQID